MLANKVPERIISERVNKIEEFLTRKIKGKYLLIRIRTEKTLLLKIYLK